MLNGTPRKCVFLEKQADQAGQEKKPSPDSLQIALRKQANAGLVLCIAKLRNKAQFNHQRSIPCAKAAYPLRQSRITPPGNSNLISGGATPRSIIGG